MKKIIIDEEKICELYKQDMPVKEIAISFNVSVIPIQRILRSKNILKPQWLTHLKYQYIDKVLDKKYISELYEKELSTEKLGQIFDCGIGMIVSILDYHDILRIPSFQSRSIKNQRNAELELTKENFEELYILKRLTFVEASKLMGVSVGYLRKKCKEWGVKIREASETRLSDELYSIKNDRKKLEEMYSTHNISEMAELLKCRHETLRVILINHGFEIKNSFMVMSDTSIEESKNEIIDLYLNTDINQKELAKKFNISLLRLSKLLRKNGIDTRKENERMFFIKHPELTKEKIFYLYLNERVSTKELADLLEVSKCYLPRLLKRWGCELRTISDASISKKLWEIKDNKDKLIELYKKYNMTQMCEMLECCIQTLKSVFVSHGIDIITKNRSVSEIELYDFITGLGIECQHNNRKLIHPYELDIVIPSHKLAIEYCGLYWHSEINGKDKMYHLNKLKLCTDLGYKLITILEDEWMTRKDLVKSKILHILNMSPAIKISARKCRIVEIDPSIKNDFLEKNHLQGRDISSINLGLFYGNKLVSVMTFGKNNLSKGRKVTQGSWELNRFAVDIDYIVRGAASKLLTHFKLNYNWNTIYSYADRRWSNGELYKKLNFTLTHNTAPNYWYVTPNGSKRLHRFKFRKSELVKQGFDKNKTEKEIMIERNYMKLWDCGNILYTYSK